MKRLGGTTQEDRITAESMMPQQHPFFSGNWFQKVFFLPVFAS
jgi:hypothetical protein